MRVAIDARELEGTPTGVGRVVAGLIESWPADDELVLVVRRGLRGFVRDGVTVRVAPAADLTPGAVWEQLVLPRTVRRVEADALVCPGYGMPHRAPCPTAVGMHDCAFASVPSTFSPRERWRRRVVAGIAARRAAFLFMGTEFAAGEARRWLGIGPDRALVLPYAVADSFTSASPDVVADVRARYELGDQLVLFVGAHLARRSVAALSIAAATLAASRPDLQLALVGRPPESGLDVLPGPTDKPPVWLGYVPDDDLPGLYSAATVVVYPSVYEGFGLPVLEALACGTPVVASDVDALAELYRDRAWLVGNHDVEGWTNALATLLDDHDARADWVAKSRGWARGRRWSEAAARLRARLAGAVEGGR